MICAETENVPLIFFYIEECMTAPRNISMVFIECAKVLLKCILKEELCPLIKYFEVKTD